MVPSELLISDILGTRETYVEKKIKKFITKKKIDLYDFRQEVEIIYEYRPVTIKIIL